MGHEVSWILVLTPWDAPDQTSSHQVHLGYSRHEAELDASFHSFPLLHIVGRDDALPAHLVLCLVPVGILWGQQRSCNEPMAPGGESIPPKEPREVSELSLLSQAHHHPGCRQDEMGKGRESVLGLSNTNAAGTVGVTAIPIPACWASQCFPIHLFPPPWCCTHPCCLTVSLSPPRRLSEPSISVQP